MTRRQEREVRFHEDAETREPHCQRHAVSTDEASHVLRHPAEDFAGSQGARIAIGFTPSGRCVKVVYDEGSDGDYLFVITAYDVTGVQLRAFRRRQRQRRDRGKRP